MSCEECQAIEITEDSPDVTSLRDPPLPTVARSKFGRRRRYRCLVVAGNWNQVMAQKRRLRVGQPVAMQLFRSRAPYLVCSYSQSFQLATIR